MLKVGVWIRMATVLPLVKSNTLQRVARINLVSFFWERRDTRPVKTEFHQIPSIDGIPWNGMELNSMELSWNSMENSMN
jgi:hypothetical protein